MQKVDSEQSNEAQTALNPIPILLHWWFMKNCCLYVSKHGIIY